MGQSNGHVTKNRILHKTSVAVRMKNIAAINKVHLRAIQVIYSWITLICKHVKVLNALDVKFVKE